MYEPPGYETAQREYDNETDPAYDGTIDTTVARNDIARALGELLELCDHFDYVGHGKIAAELEKAADALDNAIGFINQLPTVRGAA